MDIQVLWASGSIMEFQTTFLSSGNGGGYCTSQEFLDVSRPARRGVILIRRAFTFDKPDPERFCDHGVKEEKVLVEPDRVIDIVRLRVDGETILVRAFVDADGSLDPSIDAPLLNMALPGWPEVAPGRPITPAPGSDVEAGQGGDSADSPATALPPNGPEVEATDKDEWWAPDGD